MSASYLGASSAYTELGPPEIMIALKIYIQKNIISVCIFIYTYVYIYKYPVSNIKTYDL